MQAKQIFAPLEHWFAAQGWTPAAFQRQAWQCYLDGQSGLIVTATGSGKTLAAIGGVLLEALACVEANESGSARTYSLPEDTPGKNSKAKKRPTPVCRVLWITPLKALANDTAHSIKQVIDGLQLPWTLALRTGDASAKDKRLAKSGHAELIVITPESLSLLISYPEFATQFNQLRCVIVDEWHELLGSKRGVLLQLGLARLRQLNASLRIWGLSATIGNIAQAHSVLLPHCPTAVIIGAALAHGQKSSAELVSIRTLIPPQHERFAWAGNLGLSQLARVSALINAGKTTLIFANTRALAELWHQALRSVWLHAPEALGLHHGSLDQSVRANVETGLKQGWIKAVVSTSSLDLGVDFPAVDQVIQIGSAKGIARLLQRAGRAKHQPNAPKEIICAPTHALELAEYAAARVALAQGQIEARRPPKLCLDVLAQHCVTLALGGGFFAEALLAEVRSSHAFAELTNDQWQQVLDFIVQGGANAKHYPNFHRVQRDANGFLQVVDRRIALHHRLSIGTIVSEGMMQVRMMKGGGVGVVEEDFIARLQTNDVFLFAGQHWQLTRVEQMTAYVKPAAPRGRHTPVYAGGKMALSNELGQQVRQILANADQSPELDYLAPMLAAQRKLSKLPKFHQILVEYVQTNEGWNLFFYPFQGRTVHEALAALLVLRWSRAIPNTFQFAVNDYGLVVNLQHYAELSEPQLRAMLANTDLAQDLKLGVNLTEMCKRRFREIARIAGLLPPNLPGKAPRSTRQLQSSSGLIFDVFQRFDPDHVLLAQAEREIIEQQLAVTELGEVLDQIASQEMLITQPSALTPLAFPLWAENIRGALSSEDWRTRVQRAAEALERRFD